MSADSSLVPFSVSKLADATLLLIRVLKNKVSLKLTTVDISLSMGFNARSMRTVDESTLSVDVLTRYDVIWTLIKRSIYRCQ